MKSHAPVLRMVLLACAALLTTGCGPQAPPSRPGAAGTQGTGVAPATTVALEIDFGDGRKQQFASLPWRDGMTALDALGAARDSAGGPTFTHRGSGDTAFVEAIGGVANAGVRKEDRNWVFRINGRKGTKSAGVTTLSAGDHVLWQYALPD